MSGLRPTTGRVARSLLAILAGELPGARVLDLFAGTGALGVAALEAGAETAVFVESDRRRAGDLRARLRPWGERASVVAARLPGALDRLAGQRFGVVLADPPYGSREGPAALAAAEALLEPGGVAVFEHHHKQEGYADQVGGLVLARRERYGETALSFYRRRQDP